MRRVVLYMMTSVDGFIAGPDGDLDWMISPDEERQAEGLEQLDAIDTALIGRGVYEDMVRYWPTASGEYADRINAMPKLVFSRRSEQLSWNNAHIVPVAGDADLAEQVTRLKSEPGKDMVLFGGARLAQSFVRLALVDEYRLCVQPVALGSGRPLFGDLESRTALTLTATHPFPSGAALTTYRPAQPN
ncbi:dihydrofolate reductase [Actinomadura sp. KC06]|uniref:dihydrofolate reductase family protein n=1 Tax=Actinomadura sp. KC06 TaxID=2530369 RepID=UPI00105264E9|nr:dihydrofolate reductase family protein [Actinomadura sp. KC06]TDD20172.1 dihydrofolate reductase [Actinomadura sp. KC06]